MAHSVLSAPISIARKPPLSTSKRGCGLTARSALIAGPTRSEDWPLDGKSPSWPSQVLRLPPALYRADRDHLRGQPPAASPLASGDPPAVRQQERLLDPPASADLGCGMKTAWHLGHRIRLPWPRRPLARSAARARPSRPTKWKWADRGKPNVRAVAPQSRSLALSSVAARSGPDSISALARTCMSISTRDSRLVTDSAPVFKCTGAAHERRSF